MAKEMKVEIVTKETVKPSTPTPPSLKTYNLSLLDQFVPDCYVSILLFYPANFDKGNEKIDNISHCLKSSLSETLTRFYPFAGRVNDCNTSIDCNDEGAIFIEARVVGVMALVLDEYSDFSIRKKFRLGGKEYPEKAEIENHLLQVQANFFECGGLVIGLSMSHKLADASTMSTFIKAWSETSLNSDNTPAIGYSDFSMASILPASLSRTPYSVPPNLAVQKRYVFDKCKINLLKEKAIREGVMDPTRVECVSSLLWKCLISAKSRFRVESTQLSSIFNQLVNLRTRSIPPLPPNSIGNIMLISYGITCTEDQTKINLQDLIIKMRKGLDDVCKIAKNGFKTEEILKNVKEWVALLIRHGLDSYSCASWCRQPFYETDFGWGKPTWVCPGAGADENFFTLVDTRDGLGIEAWCALSEQLIDFLEQDEEFLTFATI